MKPIQTKYKGYRFRSRTEARWAVFFESLRIRWEYEIQGFDLGGEWYLPDFYLPHLSLWIEIKAGSPQDLPSHPVFDYIEENQEKGIWRPNFILIVGQPWVDPASVKSYELDGNTLYCVTGSGAYQYNGVILGDDHYRWCECPKCNLVGIEFDGRSYRLPCRCFGQDGYDKGYNSGTPRLISAYAAARQARFEHGELPS